MKMCDCVQGRLPCTCQPQPIAAQSAPFSNANQLLNEQPIAAQSAPDEREAVTMQQVLTAYEYATEHPHKYLRGTTNWCAAFAHSLNEQLGAAWQRAQSAPVVPDGYVLVPIKPTIEMVEAGYEASLGMPDRSGHARAIEMFDAMIAAAPQPAARHASPMQRAYPDWGIVRQSDKAISIVHGATYVTFSESETDKRMPWLVEFLAYLLAGNDPAARQEQGE